MSDARTPINYPIGVSFCFLQKMDLLIKRVSYEGDINVRVTSMSLVFFIDFFYNVTIVIKKTYH